jgi:hypothetical protein
MKKMLMVPFIMATLNAQSEVNEVTTASLKSEIRELKKDIEALKKGQNENSDYLNELSDFSESIETRTLEDKLKLGMGYKFGIDNFSKKYADGKKVSSNDVITSKFMLKIKADIIENMKFHTRLSMYKYWGNGRIHVYSQYDNMQGRVPSTSTLFVERAYLDWFFNKNGYVPFAITIGRQPSADGPSQQYKDNTLRKATYSALLYDGAADGAVLTFDLSKVFDYKSTYLRFGYAKGFGYSESRSNVANAYIGASDENLKDTNIFGLFFDTTFSGFKHSLVQFSYSKMKDIIANQLDPDSSRNVNIGDMDIYGAMVELSNINETNLDLFMHLGHIETQPNDKQYLAYGGLLYTGEKKSRSGSAIWLGSRYGFGENAKYKIGLEYNHGTKNWSSLTQGSFDVYNKLAVRGSAYEAYLMYVVNRYANVRVGFVNIDYDYSCSGWLIGESQEIETSTRDNLENLQSIYLKMSINY